MRFANALPTVALVTIAFAVSCSPAPQLVRNPDQVEGFRAQYLMHHPDDPFKNEIMNSQVRKDMTIMQVLAAWGLPNMRSEVSKNGSETWTYFAIDETSREVHGYQLVFDKNRLCHWVISDHPGQGILNPEDLTGLPTVGDTQTLPSGMGLEQKR